MIFPTFTTSENDYSHLFRLFTPFSDLQKIGTAKETIALCWKLHFYLIFNSFKMRLHSLTVEKFFFKELYVIHLTMTKRCKVRGFETRLFLFFRRSDGFEVTFAGDQKRHKTKEPLLGKTRKWRRGASCRKEKAGAAIREETLAGESGKVARNDVSRNRFVSKTIKWWTPIMTKQEWHGEKNLNCLRDSHLLQNNKKHNNRIQWIRNNFYLQKK